MRQEHPSRGKVSRTGFVNARLIGRYASIKASRYVFYPGLPRIRIARVASATDFVRYLDALGAYLDDGVRDYLRETDLHRYIESGAFERDLEVRKAVITIRRFMDVDDHAWWEETAPEQSTRTPPGSPANVGPSPRPRRSRGSAASLAELQFRVLDV
jgi:hypothetical protein